MNELIVFFGRRSPKEYSQVLLYNYFRHINTSPATNST